MAVVYKVQTSGLEQAVARFSGAAEVSLREAFRRTMRMLMRRVMGITPPANGSNFRNAASGNLTLADRRRGERALSADLNAIFAVLDIKDAKLAAALTRQAGGDASPLERALGIVATQEPAEVIHRRVFRANKKPGKRLQNDRPEKYLVSTAEFNRLERTLHRRIGKMASGWEDGFGVLGMRSVAWVARHGNSRGRAKYQATFWRYFFEANATSLPPAIVDELNRRTGYARRYTQRSLERQASAILLRNAQRAGFTTRAA